MILKINVQSGKLVSNSRSDCPNAELRVRFGNLVPKSAIERTNLEFSVRIQKLPSVFKIEYARPDSRVHFRILVSDLTIGSATAKSDGFFRRWTEKSANSRQKIS